MKHYKSLDFYQIFRSHGPRTKVKPLTGDFLATALQQFLAQEAIPDNVMPVEILYLSS